MHKKIFQQNLLKWYFIHKRDLPWRKTRDPYLIWLSEVILQQTRVGQGLPYYERFAAKYPNVSKLAEADQDSILKDWEGLGYYSRARNLHSAAIHIQSHLKGEFPTAYKDLLQIKGIGDYTAAAISSFAANEARPVIDGNVIRVISRYLGVEKEVNTGQGKKEVEEGAHKLFMQENPAEYNQAIMEFGALQCTPRNPNCTECPLKESCIAYQTFKVHLIPLKKKKAYKKERYFHYFLVKKDNKIAVSRRSKNDIWKGLYEFPLIEMDKEQSEFPPELIQFKVLSPHILSHQVIKITIWVAQGDVMQFDDCDWVDIRDLNMLAFPRPLRKFMDLNTLPL